MTKRYILKLVDLGCLGSVTKSADLTPSQVEGMHRDIESKRIVLDRMHNNQREQWIVIKITDPETPIGRAEIALATVKTNIFN